MLRVQVARDDRGIGRIENGLFALLDSPWTDVSAVIADTGSLDALAGCPVIDRTPLADVTLRCPLQPRALWGVGLNYRSKAAQTGRALPEQPILYLAAAASVAGPGDTVELPLDVAEPDYEGEIAIIVGRRLHRAAPSEVWPAVAGLTAANDMTARDVMRATAAPVLAKSYPGFSPLGASVCDLAELPDRDAIGVRTTVNGVLTQDDTSAGMIFPVDDLLSRLSHYAALEPGDVVLTGTPAGTGQDRTCFLTDGDEVTVEVDGVLPLTTRFRSSAGSAAGPARGRALAEPVS
jgi:2-keto-4-pentenoate hydratase/2-oxohepta-3-ene-1,7-dioic acid hydratase in catechol pathway